MFWQALVEAPLWTKIVAGIATFIWCVMIFGQIRALIQWSIGLRRVAGYAQRCGLRDLSEDLMTSKDPRVLYLATVTPLAEGHIDDEYVTLITEAWTWRNTFVSDNLIVKSGTIGTLIAYLPLVWAVWRSMSS